MPTGPPHVWDLFRLVARHQETVDRFADPFSDPTGLIDWFLRPERASAQIDEVRRAHPGSVKTSHSEPPWYCGPVGAGAGPGRRPARARG